MSRHTVENDYVTEPYYEVCVGWDNPLQTFFLQVYDHAQPDEDLQLIDWQGLQYGQIPTLADLEELAKKYCILSDKIKGELASEYEARTEPTPLQQKMQQLFKGGNL